LVAPDVPELPPVVLPDVPAVPPLAWPDVPPADVPPADVPPLSPSSLLSMPLSSPSPQAVANKIPVTVSVRSERVVFVRSMATRT
jgi:hypothetical protein